MRSGAGAGTTICTGYVVSLTAGSARDPKYTFRDAGFCMSAETQSR